MIEEFKDRGLRSVFRETWKDFKDECYIYCRDLKDEGINYALGEEGRKKDLKKALHLFKKSAILGLKTALPFVGLAYAELGHHTRSAIYFKRALCLGVKSVAWRLGWQYIYGDGVRVNAQKAFKYFATSASANCTEGYEGLAVCYHLAIGVPKSYPLAYKNYYFAILGYIDCYDDDHVERCRRCIDDMDKELQSCDEKTIAEVNEIKKEMEAKVQALIEERAQREF